MEELLKVQELYKQKDPSFKEKAENLLTSGVCHEFLYVALIEKYNEFEKYDISLRCIDECISKFPKNIDHYKNKCDILGKLKKYDDQSRILFFLYEQTHDIQYLYNLTACPFTHIECFSHIIKAYRENHLKSDEMLFIASRFIFKQNIIFLHLGKKLISIFLKIIYDIDEVTDDILLSIITTKATSFWHQSFALYYLMIPRLYYSTHEEVQNEYDRIYRNLEQLLKLPLKPMDTDKYLLHFPHNPSYYYTYTGLNIKPLLELISNLIYKLCPILTDFTSIPNKTHLNDKKRIGFCSKFLTVNHSVSRDRTGVFKMLCQDPAFEVYLIIWSDDEQIIFKRMMGDTKPYKKIILEQDIIKNITVIRDLELDIMVFPEIGMCNGTHLIAHTKLAPIQISTWGHSETSGIKTIDYYVSSKWFETKDAQKFYSEKLITMNSLSTYYYNLDILQNNNNETIEQIRREYRFYNTCKIYGVFQTVYKYHPDTIWVIREILKRDTSAIVVILMENNPFLIKRMEDELGELCARLRMIDRLTKPEYCRLLRTMDILVDSYPFGGCNTSMDAFYYEKIVMTMPSNKLNGRFTYGFYKKMGIKDAICSSLKELVTRSIYYAHHITERTELAKRIRTKMYHIQEELASALDWGDLCRSLTHLPSRQFSMHAVIARFQEDLSYLSEYPFSYTIYNKGSFMKNTIALPNVGKCDHTFLTHIINEYDRLNDITLFLPASFYNNPKKRTLSNQLMYRVLVTGKSAFVGRHLPDLAKNAANFKIDTWESTDVNNRSLSIELELCQERPYGKWFNTLFKDAPICPFITFYGILAVCKKDILLRPRSFYEQLLEYVKTPNPEAGHYIERSWAVIFPVQEPDFISF